MDPEYNFISVTFNGKDTETEMQELMVGAGENGTRYNAAVGTYPVDSNTTPIGKANNRRVEFVKM